jgi:hypothetical protein
MGAIYMELTPDQQVALDHILKFINIPVTRREEVAAVLYAAAGCGKTFLTRVIVNQVRGTHRVAGVAPTHKARKVLESFLNSDSLLKVKTLTIASLLNTMRSHSYIGTKHYAKGADSKMHLFDLFLIDEASMITDADVALIIEYALQFKRKVLFIGDRFQIPNPSQKYLCKDDFATKRDSAAFDLGYSFQLTTNVRQQSENPIVGLYTELRLAIAECREPVLRRKTKLKAGCGVAFYSDKDKWFAEIQKVYTKANIEFHKTRILAYTNDTVRSHNLWIRRSFNRGPTPEVGELLMGYNNIGWPEKIIENSQDYYVLQVVPTNTHIITVNQPYTGLIGQIVELRETDTQAKSTIFIPDLSVTANQKLLQELVRRAEKVNEKNSTKTAFKNYCHLKNKLVFMENVYKYHGEIVGEGEFRTNNPLLFKSVTEMIEDHEEGERLVMSNKLVGDVTAKYGEILTERIEDDKPLAASERLCDRYCVIEKDLDYGYCITAHKSQGSNFKTVFIDESDFDKLRDYWNYEIQCQVDATKERNQLKYVCYTRPTHDAHIFYRE